MMLEMEEVKDAALKYDKPTLARMAQMGQISPTTAVMAGMMRDRIVQSEMKPPEPPTVAEDVFAPPQAGLGAIAPQGMGGQMPMGQPQMAQAPQQGLDQIPVPEQMFQPQGMAGGGIVAFQAGGSNAALMAQYEKEVREMSEGRRMRFSPELQPIVEQLQAPRRSAEQSFLQRERQQMLGNPMMATFSGALAAQGQPSAQPPQTTVQPAVAAAQERILAQAQRGEGPHYHRPTAPADVAVVPPGGPVIPRPSLPPEPAPTAPPAPAETPSAIPGLRDRLMSRLQSAYQLTPEGTPAGIPAGTDIRSIMAEREQAEQLAGVDKNFFRNEARNIVAQRDELKGDRREAANIRLIEAGLRIMGGDSPYAFVNIGKGASEALKGFADDVKSIQKTKREYDKAERELRTAEQLYARNKSDETLKEVQRRRERAEDRHASFQQSLMNVELGLAKLGVQEAAVRVQERAAARPSEMERLIRMATDTSVPEDQRKLARNILEQRGGASQQGTLQLRALNELLTSKQNQLVLTRDKQTKEKLQNEINDIQEQMRAIGGLSSGAGGANQDLLRRADEILGIR